MATFRGLSGGVQGLLFSGANYFLNKIFDGNYIDVFKFTAQNYSISGSVEETEYKTSLGDTTTEYMVNKPRIINFQNVIFKNIITGKANNAKYDFGLTELLIEGLRTRQKLFPLLIKSLQFSGLATITDYDLNNYNNQILNITVKEKFIFLPTKTVTINGVVATPKPQLVRVVGI